MLDCGLLNIDLLWSAFVSLCFFSGFVTFIFDPSTLDSKVSSLLLFFSLKLLMSFFG